MEFIKKEIGETRKFLKENIFKIFIVVTIVFILCTISSFFMCRSNATDVKGVLDSFMQANKDLINKESTELGIGLMANNIRACIITILLGFIPFLFMAVIVMLVNSALIGLVLGVSGAAKISVFNMIVFGILPHGIFELPALFLSMAISIFLCLFLTKKLLKKEDKKFGYVFKEIVKIIVFIIIPLLVVAGLIEGIITPQIINMVK